MKVLKQFKCKRCGFEWFPKDQAKSKYCGQCKSKLWNVVKTSARGRRPSRDYVKKFQKSLLRKKKA